MFKVGDICLMKILGYGSSTYEVVIRGPGYQGYTWTVENVAGPNIERFHRCIDGPIVFESMVGRWVNNNELTLLRSSQREPTRFGKFIRRVENAVS